MSDLFFRAITFSSTFKGGVLLIVGLISLLFTYWMRKRWNEPRSIGFNIFVGLSILIVLFGLFILIFRPDWWKLPY